jgi:tripartite-type tricarboxylate transporter receptor subunit TctC
MKKIFLCLLLAMTFQISFANTFSEKPIKVIVPLGPGGGVDIIARVLSKNLAEIWKVPVIVENRPGAAGVIGGKFVAESEPDGNTLLFYVAGTYASLQTFDTKDFKFNWEKELTSLSSIHGTPFVLVVPSKTGIKNLKELQDSVKSSGLSFGSTSSGSPLHIYGELIAEKVGAKPIHVPYKAMGQAMVDVLNGNLDMLVANSTLLMPHIQSGALTPLVVFSNREYTELPGVPTIKALGNSDFNNLIVSYNFFVNSKTPDSIKEKLRNDITEATKMSLEELRDKKLIDRNFVSRKDQHLEIDSIVKSWKNATSKLVKN